MVIHLVEAFVKKDNVHVDTTFEMTSFDDGINVFPVSSPLKTSFDLTKVTKEEVLIKGNASITLVIPCNRCTKDVLVNVVVDFHRSLHLHSEEDEVYLDGVKLDVKAFLIVELIQEFPQKVLCNDECKGLCEQCGVNLNEKDCSCEKGHIDIRMAHLKDLFSDKFKEV